MVENPPAMQETQEMQVRSLSREDPLKEGMAIHSSILAWRIPWTEERDRLQSIGAQRVRPEATERACMRASDGLGDCSRGPWGGEKRGTQFRDV